MGESSAEIASLEETLRKEGYSKKAIEEVLKWYDSSQTAETPHKK